MNNTTLYLVRHGEVWNPNRVLYAWLPRFGLSKLGYFQAQKLKRFFGDKNITRIYSSPLLRARRTAEIISSGKIPTISTKFLIEINYHKWQGKKYDERMISEIEQYIKDPTNINLGETLSDCQSRIVHYIYRIAKKHQGKSIILVFHADPILCARLYFENKPLNMLNRTPVVNGSITSLTFDNKLECKKVEYLQISPAKKEQA